MRRADWIGLSLVALDVAGLICFRTFYVEPERWGGACALAEAPLVCVPRSGLLWLQSHYLWGLGALLLGGWAFLARRMEIGVAAVLVGAAGVINYNVTWGMLGLALGLWSWIMSLPVRRT
jgi:hypothetical protein